MARLCLSLVNKQLWSTASTALVLGILKRTTTAVRSLQRTFATSSLQTPTILYSSNHLLAVNKPPGWKSVPNKTSHGDQENGIGQNGKEKKSLLHYLIHNLHGGGSKNQFLLPLHRLDQPCSGILLLGKTRKAASRIQPNWKYVEKTYLAVVEKEVLLKRLSLLQSDRIVEEGRVWSKLYGIQRGKRPPRNDKVSSKKLSKQSSNVGWSVVMQPCSPSAARETTKSRVYSLQWRIVDSNESTGSAYPPVWLLELKTNQGARHMIRALFAAHGCPLVGDSRYGFGPSTTAASPYDDTVPIKLPDRSVALHARSLYLPDDKIRLSLTERRFTAPIPPLWGTYFEFDESSVSECESKEQ